MKLVADLRLINASGIGTYLKNVFPSIIELFEEVVVLGDPEEILKFDWAQKIEIICFKHEVYLLSEQIYYPFFIPKCDIFWCPHFNFPLLPINAKKTIVTIHDVNHIANPKQFSFLIRLWAKFLYENAVKRSDSILTVSEFSKSEIVKYLNIKKDKINVVFCGVNRSRFNSAEDNDKDLNLPKTYFLFVGNVKPHKNLIVLLKAYNNLDNAIKDKYKLVILGAKEGFITKENKLFDFIESNNLNSYVHFTGYVLDKKIPAIYKNASVFIFPSLYEGFGLPILEAMASGLPVISSSNASLPEIAGDAALFFNPMDANDLLSKITNIVDNEDLKNELIIKGKKRIEKFTWDIVVENHIRIIKNII